jgi:hypothetical protein
MDGGLAVRRQKQRPDPNNPAPIGDGGNLVNYVRDSINPPAGSANNLQLPQTATSMGPVLQSKFVGAMPSGSVKPKNTKGQGNSFHAYQDRSV